MRLQTGIETAVEVGSDHIRSAAVAVVVAAGEGSQVRLLQRIQFRSNEVQILLMLLDVDALRWHLEHLDHDISIGVFPQTRLHVLSISDLVGNEMTV